GRAVRGPASAPARRSPPASGGARPGSAPSTPGSVTTSATPSPAGRSGSTRPTGPRHGASGRCCSCATAIVAPEGMATTRRGRRDQRGWTRLRRTRATTVSRSSLAPEPRAEPGSTSGFRRLRREADDARIATTRTEDEPGDRDGEREAPRARATRVDEEDVATPFDERPGRVTGQDGAESRGRGLEIELGDVVDHVDSMHPDLNHVIGGKSGRPRTLVIVAPDRANGGDGPKRIENGGCADVATVDDEIAPAQLLDRLGADETMRVGDHTDDVGGRHRRL